MKAAYVNAPGPIEAILFGDIPRPSIQEDGVLVEVSYAAVNHADLQIRSGSFPMPLPSPFIIGRTMSGTVRAIGKNVRRFVVGQKVWSDLLGIHGRQGASAEFVAVDESVLNHLPKEVDEKKAAAFAHSGLTACLGLFSYAKLAKNETLLVHGGSGNTGSAAIQIAKAYGARVIATAGSQEKMDWCKMLGADASFLLNREDLIRSIIKAAPLGIDVLWDMTSEPSFERAGILLRPGGRMLVATEEDLHPPMPVKAWCLKDCTFMGFNVLNAKPEVYNSFADTITELLRQQKIRVKTAQTLPLDEAAHAHRLLEEWNPPWGKVMLKIKQ